MRSVSPPAVWIVVTPELSVSSHVSCDVLDVHRCVLVPSMPGARYLRVVFEVSADAVWTYTSPPASPEGTTVHGNSFVDQSPRPVPSTLGARYVRFADAVADVSIATSLVNQQSGRGGSCGEGGGCGHGMKWRKPQKRQFHVTPPALHPSPPLWSECAASLHAGS